MKGKIKGATKVSADAIINNRITPDATQTPVPAAQPQEPENVVAVDSQGGLDTAFSASETGTQPQTTAVPDALFEEPETTSSDTANFTVDANADTDALLAQKDEVNATIEGANSDHASITEQITNYEAEIQRHDENIARLEGEIAALEASTGELQNANSLLTANSQLLQAQIDKLDAQITANSGILGTIKNGWNTLWGNGVDVNALKAQKADLVAQKAEVDKQIEENNKQITTNEFQTNIKNTVKTAEENVKAQNEEHAQALKEQLAPLEEKILNGEATLEEIEAAIKAANEKANVEASDETVRETAMAVMASGAALNNNTKDDTSATITQTGATTNGENGTTTADGTNTNNGTQTTPAGNKEETTDNPSFTDIITEASNAINSEDENGNINISFIQNMFIMQGISPETAVRMERELSEAASSYTDMGIDITICDLVGMSAIDLDTIVEANIVQDVIRTTSTKILGNAKGITSKKEMQAQAEARDNFIADNSALSGYYNANSVSDLEVQAFLKLSDNMVSNINQGYVYETTALQNMSSQAQSLLSSYQTKVNSSNGIAEDTDTQFQQERTKTEGIINSTEAKLGAQAEDNQHLEDCKLEFLNLTSNYSSTNSDSEQISYIKLMNELGIKAQKIQDNPNSQNPYIDGSLWIAA